MIKFLWPLALAYKSKSGWYASRRVFRKELWIPPLEPTKPSTKYSDPIPVLYTNDPAAAQQWADAHFLNDLPAVVGWDMESSPALPWRETLYEGPATIQISVLDAAMVLQIAQEDTGPCADLFPFLSGILSDSSIIKAGVGIDQDMIELVRWPAEDRNNGGDVVWEDIVGRLDIGGIGGKHGSTQSLKTLAGFICGVELVKNKRLTRSNWARTPRISKRQIAYAARDAWAAVAVIEELRRRDPKQFSSEALLDFLREKEPSIYELDEMAAERKEARKRLRSILFVDEQKIDRRDLSAEQLERVQELEQKIKDLAPPLPRLFNLGPLGL